MLGSQMAASGRRTQQIKFWTVVGCLLKQNSTVAASLMGDHGGSKARRVSQEVMSGPPVPTRWMEFVGVCGGGWKPFHVFMYVYVCVVCVHYVRERMRWWMRRSQTMQEPSQQSRKPYFSSYLCRGQQQSNGEFKWISILWMCCMYLGIWYLMR